MAKSKTFTERVSIEDQRGIEWQTDANTRWAKAEERAEVERAKAKSKRKADAVTPFAFYEAPVLPDFRAEATEAIAGDVFGRFLYLPGLNLVHDTTKATPECEVQETPRVFVHFAHEIDAIAGDAEPCPRCM